MTNEQRGADAWQWRRFHDGCCSFQGWDGWKPCRDATEAQEKAKEKDVEVRPLHAAPAQPAQPQEAQEVVLSAFKREDLEAVADGLDGYEKTVNVGQAGGLEGDTHIESTTAYAARFIRAVLAAAQPAQPPADATPFPMNVYLRDEAELREFVRLHQPSAREPLTGEQMRDVARTLDPAHTNWLRSDWPCARMFARAIEAAHGITGGKT